MSFLDILREEELGGVLERYLVPVQFPHNTCIIREGDLGEGCYVIDEGIVRLEVRNTEANTDGVIGFLEPIVFVGELSLLDGKPARLPPMRIPMSRPAISPNRATTTYARTTPG